jgi:hypothetical protein
MLSLREPGRNGGTDTSSARTCAALVDTHVHLYGTFDLDRAFDAAFNNLTRLARSLHVGDSCRGLSMALFLAERDRCRVFERLASLEPALLRRHRVDGPADDGVLVVHNAQGQALQVVAGRQIATADRIEILALATTRADLRDGEPAAETLDRLGDDGLAVLAWAPGKWFGSRGRLVRSLIDSSAPGRLLIGDTSLRPLGWGEPHIMRAARRRGFGVLAGSDPFPLPGQEVLIGRYATTMPVAAGEPPSSAAEWRRLVRERATSLHRVGRRDGPIGVARRILMLAQRSMPTTSLVL